MPNPKHRFSKSRTLKKRTHKKASPKNFVICPTTGEAHLPHRAFWHEGKLYYKGKVVMEKAEIA